MKDKKVIIGVVAGLVLLFVGGFFTWQFMQNKAKEEKLKQDTAIYEVPGYDLALTALLPRDKYNYEIGNKEKPRYPTLEAKDRDGSFAIKMSVVRYSESGRSGLYSLAKEKREDFKDIEKDEKTGSLAGYSFKESYGPMMVRLDLGEKDKKYRILEVTVRDIKDVKNSKALFEKEEVQNVLKSIRIKEDYKAPEIDYIADSKDLVKIKRIADEIGGYKVKQENVNELTVNFKATKERKDIEISLYPETATKPMDTVIAENYFVKNGNRDYKNQAEIAGVKVRSTDAKDGVFDNEKEVKMFFEKDGVVFSGGIEYYEDDVDSAMEMLTQIFNNMSVDKERMKTYR